MKYIPREIVENLEDRVINENIYVKDKTVYLNTEDNKYKFENNCWFIFTNTWVNLQGGIPNYSAEEELDKDIFIAIEENK